MKIDIYQTITDNMVEAMETATGDFKMPWSANPSLPINLASGKHYRGINILQLWAAGMLKGYKSPYWLTFNQAKAKDAQVRKGEKSTPIIFWKMLKKENAQTGKEEQIPMGRAYHVFNAEQIDGLEVPEIETFENETIDAVEDAVKKTGAVIRYGNEKAAYNFQRDVIIMPDLDRFHSTESYYETLLHELTHWTGHVTRCNRMFVGEFGSENYAKEELIAELGSAFLCGHFGITANVQHPEYLKSWIAVLKDDKKALYRAAGAAQIAADFILGTKFDAVKEAA